MPWPFSGPAAGQAPPSQAGSRQQPLRPPRTEAPQRGRTETETGEEAAAALSLRARLDELVTTLLPLARGFELLPPE